MQTKNPEVRALHKAAQAMPDDMPLGPWVLRDNISNRARQREGLPQPQGCRMCQEPIAQTHRRYFRLMDGTGGWADATLHHRCGNILRTYLPELRVRSGF